MLGPATSRPRGLCILVCRSLRATLQVQSAALQRSRRSSFALPSALQNDSRHSSSSPTRSQRVVLRDEKPGALFLPLAHGCELRGGTPGATEVYGETFVMVPRLPLAAACSGAPPQRRTLVCIPHLRCSSGAAPRTSRSRRRAPFGAAPRPSGSSLPSSPPACPPGTSATTSPPAARTPPTSSAARRRSRGAAALCRPGTSTVRLSRFYREGGGGGTRKFSRAGK